MSATSPTTIALPGDQIASSNSHDAHGSGIYIHNSSLCASQLGNPTSTPIKSSASTTNAIHSIARPKHSTQTLLPTVGSIVLARVVRLAARQAIVNILSVADNNSASAHRNNQSDSKLGYNFYPAPQGAEFQGLIRVQDIRATEKDKVKVGESFRPGDIVRAVVISLGDQRDYYLSTAGYMPEDFAGSTGATAGSSKVDGNVLGVVLATSDAGNPMVPVSWKEMGDVVTGAKELRKVAKPD